MQKTRPAPRGRVGGRHASRRVEQPSRWPQQITQVRNRWPCPVTWSRVFRVRKTRTLTRVPPPVELLFLAVVVVPLTVVVGVVSGALGLLAALWTVTVT